MRPLKPVLLAALLAAGCQTTPATPPANPVPSGQTKVVVGDGPIAAAASNNAIYVLNDKARTISVVDTATEKVVKTLEADGVRPCFVKAFLDRRQVAVLDAAKGEMRVYDAFKDHALVQTIPVIADPDRVVFADDNFTAVVTSKSGDKAAILTFGVDRTKPPTRKEIAVGANGGSAVRSVDARGAGSGEVTAPKGTIVVPAAGDGAVRLIDIAAGTETSVKVAAPGPVAIGQTGAGDAIAAVVGHTDGTGVAVIDMKTSQVTEIADAGAGAAEIAMVPELGRAFVTMSGSNEVAVVDYVNKKLVTKLAVGNRPTLAAPAPPVPFEVWVGNAGDGSISVINGKEMRVRTTVPIGPGALGLTFWGPKGYVTSAGDNTLTTLNRALFPQ